MQRQQRQVLLLLDNFSGHEITGLELSNTRVEYFKPNLTSQIQPLDQGVIQTFKAHYRRL